jgi:hypothetical protein
MPMLTGPTQQSQSPSQLVDLGAAQPEPAAKPKPKPKPRPSSHYLWAALIVRIYEVFPLICPVYGGQMHLIVFITSSADIHKILDHIGVETQAPCITPARGPPLWGVRVRRRRGKVWRLYRTGI